MEKVQNVASKYPHIEWMDVESNGVLVECAIMQEKSNGDIAFFAVNSLDNTDKQRLLKIISHRQAGSHDLWDLMKEMTLNNGCNALDYFHQLVRIKTPHGKIVRPSDGIRGASIVAPTVADSKAANKKISAKK